MGSAKRSRYQYRPDFLVPPAETIRETLRTMRISHRAAAARMGVPLDELEKVLANTDPISPKMAAALSRLTGVSVGLWRNLEANYLRGRIAAAQVELEAKIITDKS